MSYLDDERRRRREADKAAALEEFHNHSDSLSFGGRYATTLGRRLGEAFDAVIAWVAAGLRCPWQPFCTGCVACQTVTSPLRPSEPLPRGPLG